MSRTTPFTTFKEVTQILNQYTQGLVTDAELLIHVSQLNGVQLAALIAHRALPYSMQKVGLEKWDDHVANWMAREGQDNPTVEDFLTGRREKREEPKTPFREVHGKGCRCTDCQDTD